MARFLRVGGLSAALGLLFFAAGCGLLFSSGQQASDAGAAITGLGTVAAGGNPIVGIALTALGGLLTAYGETRKRKEGR